ncbi:hypothetical protein [Gordonia bronchialis]|uniref:hypothetical protein n=1 Tax=Gordonia bronchialis TaxID=2054 RepID=UPI00226DF07C|nr:hypothetical protein [Gordonia bronchialis]
MSTPAAVLIAVTFLWLGMVIAISFIEAPLKFRAPGVTIPIGLGIGRLVFRALNTVEAICAIVVVVAAVVAGGWTGAAVPVTAGVAVIALVVQLVGVRPMLTRRSDQVLAGHEGPRSRTHFVYVGLELVKVIALVWLGVAALAGS